MERLRWLMEKMKWRMEKIYIADVKGYDGGLRCNLTQNISMLRCWQLQDTNFIRINNGINKQEYVKHIYKVTVTNVNLYCTFIVLILRFTVISQS